MEYFIRLTIESILIADSPQPHPYSFDFIAEISQAIRFDLHR